MQQANENWIIDRYNEILKKSILESEQVTLTLNQGGFRHSEVTDAATTDKVKIIWKHQRQTFNRRESHPQTMD